MPVVSPVRVSVSVAVAAFPEYRKSRATWLMFPVRLLVLFAKAFWAGID